MPDVAGMIWGLGEMLSRGYIVVATDHPGLGTDGIHPYLIGESEGQAELDSVRAARDLPNSGASNRFAVARRTFIGWTQVRLRNTVGMSSGY
jgi:Secretory lipase